MNILFATFGELSVGNGSIRSVSILRALADAGHQVDVAAAKANLQPHPNIRILAGGDEKPLSRKKLRMSVLRAIGGGAYHVLHAVDDAVACFCRMARWKKCRTVYEASRCFTGVNGSAPAWSWKLFPGYFQRRERRILSRVAMVLSPCDSLSSDLRAVNSNAHIVQLEDIPAHPLFPHSTIERRDLSSRFEETVSFMVVCRVLPGNRDGLQKLVMAARKVAEACPQVGFFFRGVLASEAETMARNLDILGRCVFLAPHETEVYLAALEFADAALFVPDPDKRYVDPEIMTLLYSPAPVVAVRNEAYAALLSEQNSVQVVSGPESIADGILRMIHEPLLSFGIAMEGRNFVADRHSFSSFKHRIRMAYHGLA